MTITQKQIESENNAIHEMINTCDEMIDWLSGRDEHSTQRAIGLWLDRKSALVKAYEALMQRQDSFTWRLQPHKRRSA